MKPKKIGITDSDGFVGSHLSAVLKRAGFKIIGLNLKELTKPGQALKKFVKNSDLIIHAADIKRGEESEIIAGNVNATLNLLAAVKRGGLRRLIFLSSTQAEADSVYGKIKALAEKLFNDFSIKNRAPVTIIRLPNMFGEGKKPFYSSVVATFCYQIQHGQKPSIDPKNKDKKINLIYIGDVVQSITREIIVKNPKTFRFKCIVAPNSVSIQKLADLLLSFKDKRVGRPKSKFHKDLYRTYLSYVE